MPLQATSGAASYDAFGGGVPVVPNYIEDVFSTYLYTGTGAAQTITNGIDLSTKGGLVWLKNRTNAFIHNLIDSSTSSNGRYYLSSVLDNPLLDTGTSAFPFSTSGFNINLDGNQWNASGANYASWTFRKQPKFFDVVTYTGDGTESRVISHNLGSAPGCIIIKRTDTTSNWFTFHRSATENLYLNSTTAGVGGLFFIASSASTTFTLGTNTTSNASGGTYVAYLFAHNAGGFGLTGTDNVISCGSFTTDGSSNATVILGYEPQWVMARSTAGGPWYITDNMRGMSYSQGLFLQADSSASEASGGAYMRPTATGFGLFSFGPASEPYIYIAIRRGPMKVPTSGTSVFAPSTAVEPQSSALFTAGFSDMTLHKPRLSEGNAPWITDRLRGNGVVLQTPYTSAEATYSTYFKYDSNAGAYIPASGYYNNSGGGTIPYALYAFKRSPSFFDEVCYTGTGTAGQTYSHNLSVAPELMIVKKRSSASSVGWFVYCAYIDVPYQASYWLGLNTTAAADGYTGAWNATNPTASVFTVGTDTDVNASGSTYVAYLFATCAGVSKVGSYTGTGTTLQIDCGFTAGARFVLIKRTDDVGDWYVWDSARGIVSGNDPYLLLNSTAAEVTSTDYIDTYSAGFEISSTAPAAINASGGSFIFFAVA